MDFRAFQSQSPHIDQCQRRRRHDATGCMRNHPRRTHRYAEQMYPGAGSLRGPHGERGSSTCPVSHRAGCGHRSETLRPLSCNRRDVAEGIVVGHPAMPEFTFEPREINDLLTFISGLKSRQPSPNKK